MILEKGDKVRIFREKDKKYTGPFPVLRVDDKQVFVLDGDKEKQFSIHQTMKAEDYDSINNGYYHLYQLNGALQQFISRPTKSSTKTFRVHITEILHPSDHRTKSPQAEAARKKEISDLIKRGTWKLVVEHEVPKNANIFTG